MNLRPSIATTTTMSASGDQRRRMITKRRLVVAPSASASSSVSDGDGSSGSGGRGRERLSIARTVSNKSDDGNNMDYGIDGDDDIDRANVEQDLGVVARDTTRRRDSRRNSNSSNVKKKATPWRIVALRLLRLETAMPRSRVLFFLLFPLCLYQVVKHSSTASLLSIPWPTGLENLLFSSIQNEQQHVEPTALYGKHSRMLQYYSADDKDDDSSPAAAAAAAASSSSSSSVLLRGASNLNNNINAAANSRHHRSNWTIVDQFLWNHTTHFRRDVLPLIPAFKRDALRNGDYYEADRYALPIWETKHCRAQYDWQKATFLNCNTLHELPLVRDNTDEAVPSTGRNSDSSHVQERTRILGAGYYRDVWLVPNPHDQQQQQHQHPNVILKSIRYKHNFEPDQFDRNRRDAIAQERLTKSQFVTDIYGFCGGSGLFEYASGGDMKELLLSSSWRLSKREKFRMGVQAAMAIADVHTVEGGGTAKNPIVAMAHTDISPQQFVLVNSERHHNVNNDQHPRRGPNDNSNDDEDIRVKLTDFNRVRMLRIDPDRHSPCPYKVKKNGGRLRSPEEYAYTPQTEKVDIYSLGNILYMLLTNETRPFDSDSTDTAVEKVKRGERPFVSQEIRLSPDPIDQALLKALNMCQVQDIKERPTALQVANFLKANLELIDPGRLESWGVMNV